MCIFLCKILELKMQYLNIIPLDELNDLVYDKFIDKIEFTKVIKGIDKFQKKLYN